MRQALPKGLVKANLSIPGREAAKLDFLRLETEASSDSEITRQALRHLEQLVEDEKHDIVLKVVSSSGEDVLSSSRFRDRPESTKNLTRRSLILHEQSAKRLAKLQHEMKARDFSEVVRCALRFYEKIVRASVNGAQFIAELPTGEKYRVRFGSFGSAEPVADPTEKTKRESDSHQKKPPGARSPGGYIADPEPSHALASAQHR